MAEEQLKEVTETVDPAAPAAEAPKAAEVEQPKPDEAVAPEAKTVEPAAAVPPVVAEEEIPVPDWKDKELKKKHAQIKDKDRKLAEREQELADMRVLLEQRVAAPPAEGEQPAPRTAPVAPSATQAQIQEAARQLREQERYQENLATTNAAGEKAYGKDWGAALENLATLGTVEADVMTGILATDAPQKVLFELGKRPEEMQRIMELPPARRQTEFVKLSLKETPKQPVSQAPAPTEPISGRVSPSAVPSDNDDDDTWYAKWNAMQEAKRKKSA